MHTLYNFVHVTVHYLPETLLLTFKDGFETNLVCCLDAFRVVCLLFLCTLCTILYTCVNFTLYYGKISTFEKGSPLPHEAFKSCVFVVL